MGAAAGFRAAFELDRGVAGTFDCAQIGIPTPSEARSVFDASGVTASTLERRRGHDETLERHQAFQERNPLRGELARSAPEAPGECAGEVQDEAGAARAPD